MKWTIRQLKEHLDESIMLSSQHQIKEDLLKRNQEIIDVKDVQLEGYFLPSENEIILHGLIKSNLTLPSSRSLVPVEVQLEIPIKERYVYPEYDTNHEDYEETTIVLEKDYIDLDEAIIESILLNIPIKVLHPDEEKGELPSGNDWSVITEEDYEDQLEAEKSEKIDPRFAALKSLIDNNQEED